MRDREAEARLAAYGSGIRAAESRTEVGDRFAIPGIILLLILC